ncbi:MAG: glutamate formimidoyltransferase [Acetobacteraceae bacterium]|nr:glutamate formimidoyltransferase [Acetobacteraceae bacterium]
MAAGGDGGGGVRLVECVPNFSEGRRPDVIRRVVDAAASASGVRVLDVSSDAVHNRTVLTLAGEPGTVAEAAFRATRAAAGLIDLRRHQGAHPRIGAMDVIPLVPVSGVEMAECVACARALGQRIAGELGIPVYLYAEAATRPERRELSAIRRGGFEGLAAEIGRPERLPDFGPPRLHPSAGAIAVGARGFLIAFNVNLGTSDVAVARRIARAVRASSGGLPCVQAVGIAGPTPDTVQVSMNLTDYTRTPLHRVWEEVGRLAAGAGAAVVSAEIVGLVPERALLEAAEHLAGQEMDGGREGAAPGSAASPSREAGIALAARALRLAGFDLTQVFEVRLAQAVGGEGAGG